MAHNYIGKLGKVIPLIPPYSPFVGWLPIPRCGPSPIPGQAKIKLGPAGPGVQKSPGPWDRPWAAIFGPQARPGPNFNSGLAPF